jgi:hypothetical protein
MTPTSICYYLSQILPIKKSLSPDRLQGPTDVGVDPTTGDIFSVGSYTSSFTQIVVKSDPSGTFIMSWSLPGDGIIQNLSVDLNGNVYAGYTSVGLVYFQEYTSSGVAIGGPIGPFNSDILYLANDPITGNLYILYGTSVYGYSSSPAHTPLPLSPFTYSGSLEGIAIDKSQHIYLGNNLTRSLVEINETTGGIIVTDPPLPIGNGFGNMAYNPVTNQIIVAYLNHFEVLDTNGNLLGNFGAGNFGQADMLGVGVDPNGCVLATVDAGGDVERWCPCGVNPPPTDTPTNTATNTSTNTPTNTATYTPTKTPTNTPTLTPTNTQIGGVMKPLGQTDSEGSGNLTPTMTFTPTVTPSPTQDTILSTVMALPNVSRNGQPIQFKVNLTQTTRVQLTLFTLLGEQIYQASAQGSLGENSIVWDLKNHANSLVSSGIYVYILQTGNGTVQKGKVVVIH